jgi:hypothetical protein
MSPACLRHESSRRTITLDLYPSVSLQAASRERRSLRERLQTLSFNTLALDGSDALMIQMMVIK